MKIKLFIKTKRKPFAIIEFEDKSEFDKTVNNFLEDINGKDRFIKCGCVVVDKENFDYLIFQ